MNRTYIIKIALCLILPIKLTCWSLDSDNRQLVHITSNQAIINFKSGSVTYAGNVMANQGTRHVTGNQLIVNKAKSGGAQSVTAYGNPAYAQYQPTLQSTVAHGQAEIITYNFPSYLFIFKNQARLEQNNNIFTGPLITYNTHSKEVHSPTNKLIPTIITLPPYNQEKLTHD